MNTIKKNVARSCNTNIEQSNSIFANKTAEQISNTFIEKVISNGTQGSCYVHSEDGYRLTLIFDYVDGFKVNLETKSALNGRYFLLDSYSNEYKDKRKFSAKVSAMASEIEDVVKHFVSLYDIEVSKDDASITPKYLYGIDGIEVENDTPELNEAPTLSDIAHLYENNGYEVEATDKWVKITDEDLWPDLNIYFFYAKDYDEDYGEDMDDEIIWNLHIPTNWNSVISPYKIENINEFVEKVNAIYNNAFNTEED